MKKALLFSSQTNDASFLQAFKGEVKRLAEIGR
jgi:hypothetical protein